MTGDYSWGAVRINRIFATRLRAAPQYGFGLRRRNNEFNELTNCWAARGRRIAPEGGAYSRIGACPYLPPQLINSRCCPCKGRISWAGLAPQYLSRYEPLTGARFINRLQEVGASPYPKYEPPSGALAPRVWRQVRINRIFATGLRAAPQYGFGLRRRNNELNELTNCRAARVRGLPLKGAHIPG